MSSSDTTIDSAIPEGPWTLYFHAHDEAKWNLASFTNIGTMSTWREFWSLMDGLRVESLADGMFFLMRDPIPPLWENHQNIRGGSYSIRIQKRDAGDIFIAYTLAAMLGNMTLNGENQINGISISPKKGFNILKIWNIDSTRFKDPADIHILSKEIKPDDIMYTPFVQKKM
jgi:hypothetical protein